MALDFVNGCKFTTSAAGTVDWPVTGAATGYMTPAQAGATSGNTYRYRAENASLSEWEIGTGTYTTVGGATLVRTAVLLSSNAGAKVNFTVAPTIGLTVHASDLKSIRDKLTANRSYFVATTGSDSNSGLAIGTPFLTKQKAMDVITETLDVAGFTVTVNVADGAYTAGVAIKGWVGGGIVDFVGNVATPANVTVTMTGYCFAAQGDPLPGIVRIRGFTLDGTTGGILTRVPGRLQYTNIRFAAGHFLDAGAVGNSAVLEPYGNNEYLAGAHGYGILIDSQGQINWANNDLPSVIGTLTMTGTPSFGAFLYANGNSFAYMDGGTISGASTGSAYQVAAGAQVLRSNNIWPGSTAGTVSTGGRVNSYDRPTRSVSAAYTLILADVAIVHPAADTTARIWTIPANSAVPYGIGHQLFFNNEQGAGAITLAITTDTMTRVGAGTTGSVVIPTGHFAIATKITATTWQLWDSYYAIDPAQGVGFRAHKNGTTQTVVASTATQLTFSTEAYDLGADFAANAWTPPAGLVDITASAGFIKNPETENGTPSATQGVTATFTYMLTPLQIPNGATIYSIGVYSIPATTGSKVKIARANSTTSFDFVVDQSFNHAGGGWQDVVLTTPYVVPDTGSYCLGLWGNLAAMNQTTVAAFRSVKSGDQGGAANSAGWSNLNGVVHPMRCTLFGGGIAMEIYKNGAAVARTSKTHETVGAISLSVNFKDNANGTDVYTAYATTHGTIISGRTIDTWFAGATN
jgi:hypothetical protein